LVLKGNPIDLNREQRELLGGGDQQVGAVRGLNYDTWCSAHKQQLVEAVDCVLWYNETEPLVGSWSVALSKNKKNEKVRE
jgi:hypothetical protein